MLLVKYEKSIPAPFPVEPPVSVSIKRVETTPAPLVPYECRGAAGLDVPIPTDPLLVAKLAPVVLDNAPVTASPVEEMDAPRVPDVVVLLAAT